MPGLLGRVRADAILVLLRRGPRRARRAGATRGAGGAGVSCRWCAAQGGGHVQLCVGVARGVARRETRAARVCRLRPPVPPRPLPGRERGGGGAVGVFVRHTARRRLWGVGAACEEAAGKRRASPVRRYTAGGGPPPAQRRMCVRAFAGLRGCGAPHGATSVCGRGGGRVTSGLSESRRGAVQGASRGGACASARPPDPVARGRLPKRRARQDEKKMPERRLHMGPPEPRGHLGPPKEAVKGGW